MSESTVAYNKASEARRAADVTIERIHTLEGIVAGLLRLNGHSVRKICRTLSWPQTRENFKLIEMFAKRYE